MNKEREALTLALEALRDNQHLVADNERHAYVMEYNGIIEKCEKTLSQPAVAEQHKQEPAYWQWRRKQDDWQVRMIFSHEVRATTEDSEVRTLYTIPPQPKEPEQEPVACYEGGEDIIRYKDIPLGAMLYTTPPQRTWVGLTDEVKTALNEWQSKANIIDYVEQWLKEKNT